MAQQGANGLGYFDVQTMLKGAGAGLEGSATYMQHIPQQSLCQTVMSDYQGGSTFTLGSELQLIPVTGEKVQLH